MSAARIFPQFRSCYIQAMKKLIAAVLLVMVFAGPAFAATAHHRHHRHHHHRKA
jgi:hypothetical protein